MNAVEERGERVVFAIEVSVPFNQSGAFADALTGNDNDIVLAAERAMRSRIEECDIRHAFEVEEIELAVVDEGIVKPFLAEVMGMPPKRLSSGARGEDGDSLSGWGN